MSTQQLLMLIVYFATVFAQKEKILNREVTTSHLKFMAHTFKLSLVNSSAKHSHNSKHFRSNSSGSLISEKVLQMKSQYMYIYNTIAAHNVPWCIPYCMMRILYMGINVNKMYIFSVLNNTCSKLFTQLPTKN